MARQLTQLRNYLSFKEFVEKYVLKNEATSNVKIKEILNELNIPCRIHMRDDKFNTTIRKKSCLKLFESTSGNVIYKFLPIF